MMAGEQEKIDTLQAIELAEGVVIRLRVAGPVPRMFAHVLDLLIQGAGWLVVYLICMLSGLVMGFEVASGLMLLVTFLSLWWYPVFFEASRWGATPGKRVMKLRVVQPSGAPITFGQAIIRNFLRFVDGQPGVFYGFGLASCLATKRFQRLGDLAAGTVVVYDRLDTIPAAGVAQMEEVRPKVPLTRDEARAVMSYRDRARGWSDARRQELADLATDVTGAKGASGVARLLSIAQWLEGGGR